MTLNNNISKYLYIIEIQTLRQNNVSKNLSLYNLDTSDTK